MMTRHAWLAWLLSVAIGASASVSAEDVDDLPARRLTPLPSAVPKVSVPANDLLALAVVVQTRSGAFASASPGATLRSGERVAFLVSLRREAYVYLVQVFADGKAALLYPSDDESALLPAGSSRRAPSDAATWFRLDDQLGVERLLVVASRKPLQKADHSVSEWFATLRSEERWPSEFPAPAAKAARDKKARAQPAPTATARSVSTTAGVNPAALESTTGPLKLPRVYRGFVREREEVASAPSLIMASDKDGLAIAALQFQHVK